MKCSESADDGQNNRWLNLDDIPVSEGTLTFDVPKTKTKGLWSHSNLLCYVTLYRIAFCLPVSVKTSADLKCRLSKVCPPNHFAMRLTSGAADVVGPQICFEGKMCVSDARGTFISGGAVEENASWPFFPSSQHHESRVEQRGSWAEHCADRGWGKEMEHKRWKRNVSAEFVPSHLSSVMGKKIKNWPTTSVRVFCSTLTDNVNICQKLDNSG